MTAADSVAKDLEAKALYDRGCDQLDEEYLSKAVGLAARTRVTLTAYQRARAEYETAISSLPAEQDSRAVKFVNQLQASATALHSDYLKACDALDAMGDRYDLKFLKLESALKGSRSC